MNRREAIKRAALLSGYAITASAMTGALQACQQTESKEIWQPAFFDQEQFASFSEMMETILPRTDTPGAKDVGVPRFLDTLYKEIKKEKIQQLVLQGIERANSDCQAIYGHRFEECTPSEKNQLFKRYDELAALEEKPEKSEVIDMGSFIRELKDAGLFAYFTSEQISKNHLYYEPIPGNYDGCVELASLDGVNHVAD